MSSADLSKQFARVVFATEKAAATEARWRNRNETGRPWKPQRGASGDWTIVLSAASDDGVAGETGPPRPALEPLDLDAAVERYAAVIRRIARDKRIRRRSAQRFFTEMLKFLDVCAQGEETVSPPRRVDDAWHAFILFTRDYAAFCEDRFGFFIHHDPADSFDPDAYERAYLAAGESFGDLDGRVWPRPGSRTGFGGWGERLGICGGGDGGGDGGGCGGGCGGGG